MKRYTIYINDKLDDEFRELSQLEGRSLNDLIRSRLETSLKMSRHEGRLQKIENKIDAIYSLLDFLAGDIGYMSGATRISTKSIEHIKEEGLNHEAYVRRVSSALKTNFEQN